MVNEKSTRVYEALTSLVKLYLPFDDDGKEDAANDRREDLHAILRDIVDGYASLSHTMGHMD